MGDGGMMVVRWWGNGKVVVEVIVVRVFGVNGKLRGLWSFFGVVRWFFCFWVCFVTLFMVMMFDDLGKWCFSTVRCGELVIVEG